MLARLVGGSKAAENRDTVARDLNANLSKGRIVNVNRIGGVGQCRVEHGEFAAVEVEQAGRCCVGGAVGHQRVLDEKGDFKHRAGRGCIAKAERGEVLGGNPKPGVARGPRGQREFHLFLGVGKAVLPTPRTNTGILTAPFVPLVEVEVEGWPSRVLATEEVHGERFSVPSGEIAHVAIGGKHRHDPCLHANRALVGRGEVRQADVHPSVLRVEAHLNLAAGDRAVEFRIVQRCVGQHPRRGQGGVLIGTQHTNAGDVGCVGHGPSTGQWVGDERLMVGTVAGDGMHFGHARSTAFEFKVQAELVDQVVVEEVDGDNVVV